MLMGVMDHASELHCQSIEDAAPYQWYAARVRMVEVVRAGHIYRLRFLRPKVCQELDKQPLFRETMKAEKLVCLTERDGEAAGFPFMRRANEIIRCLCPPLFAQPIPRGCGFGTGFVFVGDGAGFDCLGGQSRAGGQTHVAEWIWSASGVSLLVEMTARWDIHFRPCSQDNPNTQSSFAIR